MEEFKKAIEDRLNSPIVGTYSIYLILLNWKVFVFLLSDLTALEKVAKVNELVVEEGLANAGLALLLTLLTLAIVPLLKNEYEALLALIKFHRVETVVDRLARRRETEDKNSRTKIQKVSSCKQRSLEISNVAMSTRQRIEEFKSQHDCSYNLKRFFAEIDGSFEQIGQSSNQIMTTIDDFNSEMK